MSCVRQEGFPPFSLFFFLISCPFPDHLPHFTNLQIPTPSLTGEQRGCVVQGHNFGLIEKLLGENSLLFVIFSANEYVANMYECLYESCNVLCNKVC